MCELFAMSARQPATVSLSLEEFARHGGETARHRDGWGVAYFDDGDARLLKEAAAASDSAFMDFVERHRFRSTAVICHIRRATQGAASLKNTHPFTRELGGMRHVFAHNGNLVDAAHAPALALGRYRPIGDTDSEIAFCALLHRLESLWMDAAGPPPRADRQAVVAEFAADIRRLGPANFLYGDGDAIFVHADRRTQSDGEIKPPGLHILHRACAPKATDFAADGLTIASPEDGGNVQEAVLVASVPLTDEAWMPLGPGEIMVLTAGEAVAI